MPNFFMVSVSDIGYFTRFLLGNKCIYKASKISMEFFLYFKNKSIFMSFLNNKCIKVSLKLCLIFLKKM